MKQVAVKKEASTKKAKTVTFAENNKQETANIGVGLLIKIKSLWLKCSRKKVKRGDDKLTQNPIQEFEDPAQNRHCRYAELKY